MFFSKKYQLLIPTPCHENWEGMTPVDKGRYCDACAKTVVDYSTKSANEITEMIRNNSVNSCGRFTKEQLEKTYTVAPQVQLTSQKRVLQYMFTFLLASKAFIHKAIGQDTLKLEQTDSLNTFTKVDSCLADTVALAIADTANLKLDSLIAEWMEGEVVTPKEITFETILSGHVYGGLFYYRETLIEFPFAIRLFDSLRSFVSIKKGIRFEENKNPKPPQAPLKKAEEMVSVLPEEIKRKGSKENR
jgi:hypothetical protein